MSMYAAPTHTVSLEPQDPWAKIAGAYGLGAPPAQGMPAVMPGVQVGQAPQMGLGSQQFLDFMDQISGRIGNAYNYNTPQMNASLIDPSQVPQTQAQQMGQSDELKRLLGGEGYSAKNLAQMRATATEQPAQAGLQQLSQMKRMLGQSGISGGAAAAVQGDIARQTGQAQGQAMRDVDVRNAEAGMENTRYGVGQQTQIGMNNMQAANQMALANANMMYQSLQANQQAQNSASQFNTGLKAQQSAAGASSMSSFFGQQGAQGQDQRQQKDMQNTQNQWDQQKFQAGLDWDKQKSQWDQLNQRYGQSQNILGAWGA
jgi:hypothetical protein